MEYCSENTLRSYLDDKDYKVNRRIIHHLFKQLIDGLAHIHEEDLIHRDIKPVNIFIDKSRMSLKIGDFGLAKMSIGNPLAQEDLKRNHWSLSSLNQFKENLEKSNKKTNLK